MDLPTPVPASTIRLRDRANALRTASAIATCSPRCSYSSYREPTTPSAVNAWATASAVGSKKDRPGSAAISSASTSGLRSVFPTRSRRRVRSEKGSGFSSLVSPARSAKYSNTTTVGQSFGSSIEAISRSNIVGMASTAASRIRRRAQVAATSSSARCVDRGAPKAFTRSMSRWDFMRGSAMRDKSRESTQVFSSSGQPVGCFVVKLRSNSALWATTTASPTKAARSARASDAEGASATSSS